MLDRIQWNSEVIRFAPPFGAFLQSYEWGMFQEAIGRKIMRVFEPSAEHVFLGTVITMSVGYGISYGYIPKGPLGNVPENALLPMLRGLGATFTFLRIEPTAPSALLPVSDVQPSSTVLIDLTKDEEVIFEEMKSKTRYNVRLGERKGVEVREMDAQKEFNAFWLLMQQTAVRDHIRLHDAAYYKALLKAMSQKEEGGARARLFGAFYDGRLLATNIIVDFAGVRTYLHGATSNVHRNVMAQYVLHATLIRDAKKEGMHTFDFWGAVSEEDEAAGHSWAGISRYKRSFGGQFLEMPGTYDFVLKPLQYEAYRVARRIRRIF